MKAKLQRDELRSWLRNYVAELIGASTDEINTADKLMQYDLDSLDSLRMAVEMEEALGVEVPSDTFFDGFTTLDEVVDQFKMD